jgi:hypothetical protein
VITAAAWSPSHLPRAEARSAPNCPSADNLRLVAHYERTGHHWIGEAKTRDPKTGRELHYRHFAKDL